MTPVIVVVAALKGGVGKTTTSVYLAALAETKERAAVIVDADPQASAADWLENSDDEQVGRIEIIEAPTDRSASVTATIRVTSSTSPSSWSSSARAAHASP